MSFKVKIESDTEVHNCKKVFTSIESAKDYATKMSSKLYWDGERNIQPEIIEVKE